MDSIKQIPAKDIVVGERFRKDLGDLAGLAKSIGDIGLLQPIGVTPGNRLIFGERRLRACVQLGWKTVPCRVLDLASLLRGEHDENEYRKDLKPFEKVAIADAVKAELGNRQGHRTEKIKTSGQLPGSSKHAKTPKKGEETREVAAKAAGLTTRELGRLEAIREKCPQSVREAVNAETVKASDAAAVADEAADVQEKALEQVSAGKAKTLKQAVAQVKAEQEHGDDEEKPTDLFGQVIPSHLLYLLGDFALMDDIAAKAREVRLLLNKWDKCPTNREQRGTTQGHFGYLEKTMQGQRFGAVCPVCRGEPADVPCDGCTGKLWYTVAGVESILENAIERKRYKLDRPGVFRTWPEKQKAEAGRKAS